MELFRLAKSQGWDWRISKGETVLLVPEKSAADRLIDFNFDRLAKAAANLRGEIKVSWDLTNPGNPDPDKTYVFSATMGGLNPQNGGVVAKGAIFSAVQHLPAALLVRMASAAENEKPVSIVRRHDKRQIAINQPMEEALRTPAPIACERIMGGKFWRDRDLEYVEQQFACTSKFSWHYNAGLREDLWAILESDFERFEVNGEWYGQTTFLVEPEIVPYPADLLVSPNL